MTSAFALPILVAGGGIGGLSAALGLAQKGWSVVVLEKAPSLGEIGAGVQLGPNAFHCFDYLGVGEAARTMAVYIDKLRLMDAITGEEITHIDLGEPFEHDLTIRMPWCTEVICIGYFWQPAAIPDGST